MLKAQFLVKRCGGRVSRKQAEGVKMKPCPGDDRIHQQDPEAFPPISLADVQVADAADARICDIGVDIKAADPDQFGA